MIAAWLFLLRKGIAENGSDIYENKTRAAAAFVDVAADGIIHDGEFAL